MNYIDAFMWVTALTYFAAVPLPVKFQKNWGFITQKVAWLAMGIVWVLFLTVPHPIFENPINWLVLGVVYVLASLLSYTGVQDWGSPGHNIAMFVWDLLLAIICLTKI
ncbi:hypothetical protein ES707_10325 [subsurface metagenome]